MRQDRIQATHVERQYDDGHLVSYIRVHTPTAGQAISVAGRRGWTARIADPTLLAFMKS